MSSLFNKRIKDTYSSLIKTETNEPIGLTYSRLTDGDGNLLPIQAKQGAIAIDGDFDLSGANVIGFTASVDGTSGTSGVSGVSGSSGTSGTSGASGRPRDGFVSTQKATDITGTTNETISRSVFIAANTFYEGDWLIFNSFLEKTGVANTATERAYFNTQNNLSGAILFMTNSVLPAFTTSYNTIRNLRIRTSNGSGDGTLVLTPTNGVLFTDYDRTTTTNILGKLPIDWTIDQYLIITYQLANSADSIVSSAFSLMTSWGQKGDSGTSGTSGSSGVSGSSGTSGTSGVSPTGAITSVGPNTILNVWSGSQAQYNALSPTYSNTTIYFIE